MKKHKKGGGTNPMHIRGREDHKRKKKRGYRKRPVVKIKGKKGSGGDKRGKRQRNRHQIIGAVQEPRKTSLSAEATGCYQNVSTSKQGGGGGNL